MFTHMAVAGERIAAVCEDNTINVYDAVTGVIRLTLNAPQRVTDVAGSPDGSILFCSHQRFHEITLWDMQTGGLIHSFTTKSDVSDIVVSPTGRYLGGCLSDSTFKVWDVERRCEWSRFWAMCACWLGSEDHIALGFRKTVVVLEIPTGRTLHTFPMEAGSTLGTTPMEACVEGIAYSAGQHRLAVCLTSRTESTIMVIDIRTGLTSVSVPSTAEASKFTFSGNGDRVLCVSSGTGLRFFDTTTPTPHSWCNYPSDLGSVDSIGFLRSGHLVVNVGDSIQLLATEHARPSGTSLDSGISHVYPFDNGRAMCTSSRDHPKVHLLDTKTMKTLADYRVRHDALDPSFPPPITCVSLDQYIAVLCHPKHDAFVLGLHVIGSVLFQWRSRSPLPVLLGVLSPDGKTLITVGRSEFVGWEIYARTVSGGDVIGYLPRRGEPPRNIGFTSDTQLYIEHEVKDDDVEALALVAASVASEGRFHTKGCHMDRPIRTAFTLAPGGGIFHLDIRELPGRWIPPAPPYGLDESLEWVVDAKSRRVCWLPPGYVTGIEGGHFFAGSSIVMAGRDGILRRLTFREPRSDS
jgi:WD40 repeat protein